jgi:hypothetical protein
MQELLVDFITRFRRGSIGGTAPSGPVRLVPRMGAYAQRHPDRILILRPVPRPLGNLLVRPSLSPVQSFGRRPARATQMEPSGSRLRNVRTKP